jgi:pimeloyl-ACP methyl ester carboxylesterase
MQATATVRGRRAPHHPNFLERSLLVTYDRRARRLISRNSRKPQIPRRPGCEGTRLRYTNNPTGTKDRAGHWRSKPSFYAVSTEDRTINPDLERFMAKRMKAQTIEIRSSHLSLISHPTEIADLIIRATSV